MATPNILFFFTDQQRADTCGAYGAGLGLTPNLDQLAAEGVTFENAVSNQPVCGPARAILQTGRYATNTGCYRNAIPLEDDGQCLAHLLEAGGYTTNYIGKWHLAETGTAPVPLEKRCGYTGEWKAADLLEFTSDAYEGYLYDRDNTPLPYQNRYRTDVLTGYAADFIRGYSQQKPFFLMVSYLEPHHQNTSQRYIAPEGYAKQCEALPPLADLVALQNTEGADWQQGLAEYYGCIKKLDENLGELVTALKERGLYEDTILVFSSDHGNHFRTRNSEYKRSCHEASVRIPLVVRGGAYRGGRRVAQPVSQIDFVPTILEMAGLAAPVRVDGHAAGCLLGEAPGWDEDVYIQISESEVARALRTPRWKYCVAAPHKDGWLDSGSELYVEQALYDLQADPYELDNLAGKPGYAEVRRALRARLEEKMAQAKEPARIIPLE